MIHEILMLPKSALINTNSGGKGVCLEPLSYGITHEEGAESRERVVDRTMFRPKGTVESRYLDSPSAFVDPTL
jgi:hypothetical protein